MLERVTSFVTEQAIATAYGNSNKKEHLNKTCCKFKGLKLLLIKFSQNVHKFYDIYAVRLVW
jgi:hypothetical protein